MDQNSDTIIGSYLQEGCRNMAVESGSQKGKQSVLKRRSVVILATLFCCFLWGSAFPAVAASYDLLRVNLEDTFQIILFAGIRFMIAASLIFAYAIATGKKMRVEVKGLGKIAILGLLQTFGQYVFFFLSMRTVHPANASILASTGIFFTVIIAHFIYKDDRLTSRKVLGLFLGMSGIVILNGGASGTFSFTGEGFMIMSMLLSAVAGVYTKKLARSLSPYAIAGYQLLLGSMLLIGLGLVFSGPPQLTLTWISTPLLVYLGFISAAAFTTWSAILKHNHISKVSVYKFSIPIFGVLISFVFFRGTLDLVVVLISLILVAVGIVLINFERKVPTT